MTDATPKTAPDDEIAPAELKALLDTGSDVQLIDVREPWEAETAVIAGSTLIPLGQVAERVGELDADRPVVAYCHGGFRSLKATGLLRAAGLDARSLTGGIDAWSVEIDPSVPRY